MNKNQILERQAEWESWEHLIAADLKALNHRIKSCLAGMSNNMVSRKNSIPYVNNKIMELVEELGLEHIQTLLNTDERIGESA